MILKFDLQIAGFGVNLCFGVVVAAVVLVILGAVTCGHDSSRFVLLCDVRTQFHGCLLFFLLA